MSVQKKPKLKRKGGTSGDGEAAKKKPVVLEFDKDEYGGGEGGSNALIIEPTAKKAKGETVEKPPKRRNLVKQRKEEKISKSKRRKLANLVDRKKKRQTQDELLAELATYQLDAKGLGVLSSTAHRQDKTKHEKVTHEPNAEVVQHPHKIKIRETIHSRVKTQEHYYETDSGSSEEDEEEVKEEENEEKIEEDEEAVEEPATDEVQDALDEGEEGTEKTEEGTRDEEGEGEKKETKRVDRPEDEDDEMQLPAVPAPTVSSGWQRTPVIVHRDEKIQESRSALPIFGEEQSIVEAINENISCVVCGETGSGKTTQIPQMLYEAGYCTDGRLIGVTEPRRVAAVSMARRVGEELGVKEAVSYQIRYEGNRSEKTKILFMTDGVLMKEMSADIRLQKYSVIIIDEAHERSLYSDVLIGLLSRVAPLRAKSSIPLKLIIMSATLRLDDFLQKKLFPTVQPRVIKVEARQFPVTIHFDKRTPQDAHLAAFRKTCRIHESLPEGGILIFVPGQRDVLSLIKKLQERYPIKYEKMKDGEACVKGGKKWKMKKKEEAENATLEDLAKKGSAASSTMKEEKAEREGRYGDEEEGADGWDGESEEDEEDEDSEDAAPLAPPPPDCQPLYCLPLYSLLSSAAQRRVFDPPPEGTRLCVVSTNVAETSLTIPGIKYVVDGGFEKRRLYDPITGVSQFVVARCSQASSDQRAGRSGRVGPGHAYRLYSSAVFTDMEKFSRPEILDKPADQLVLQLKSMNIIKVVNFPFPSAPPRDSMEAAEQRLIRMGALAVGKSAKSDELHSRMTPLGKTLCTFPLAPAYAKILALAHQHNLIPHAIQMVAALSVREPMMNIASIRGETMEETKKLMAEALKQRRGWVGKGPSRRLGDLLVLMKAVTAAEEGELSPAVCAQLGARAKAMLEIRKLRVQLTNVVNTSFGDQADVVCDQKLPAPTDAQAVLLRQAVTCGLADRIARRVDRTREGGEEVPKGAYQTQTLEDYVFIDAASMLYREEPDWVVYQEIVQVTDKKCLQGVMAVEEEWLPKLAEAYCNYGEPPKDQDPSYSSRLDTVVHMVPVSFGARRWPMSATEPRPLKKDIMMYRHFARLLLAGEVIPKLAEWVPKMLAPPATMIKSWAKLQQRTEDILNALIEKEAISRTRLLEVWSTESSFLLDEYLQWLPESVHDSVHVVWPPIGDE